MSTPSAQSWYSDLVLHARAAFARIWFGLLIKYVNWKSSARKPDVIRSFTSHPKLKHRIFYPPNFVAQAKLPLYFDIHGGGFIIGNPSLDDATNWRISQELNCIVISCDYSKSPAVRYPVASNEIADTILDVLSGHDSLFDKSKVAVGGYSAGGNLTISVAQCERLRNKIAAAIAWYPATDFSDDLEPKILLRPYRLDEGSDDLLSQIPLVKASYVPHSQDLRDPRLSVVYTDRSHLPKDVLIFGAQNDILCHEAWRMARRLTGQDDVMDWEKDQEAKYRFDHDNVRWRLIRDAKHGYTHFAGARVEEEKRRQAQAEESFAAFKQFMLEGPFK